MSLTVGVDVGGTKIALALVDKDGAIVERTRVETPEDTGALVEAITTTVTDWADDHDVTALGLGIAGFVALDGRVLVSPNIPWLSPDVGSRIEESTGLTVDVENDAAAAAWGEYRFGAGADDDDLVLVTLGTGIGGGFVLDGRLYRGAFGVAAEIGHLQVEEGGRPCPCGQRGCWERYASGTALTEQVRTTLQQSTPSGILADLTGGDPAELTGPMITEAAQAGDATACGALDDVGRWLGIGLASLTAILDPGLIVLGGGLAAAGDLILNPTEETYRARVTAGRVRPPATIRLAQLGNEAGMIGAADLARSR